MTVVLLALGSAACFGSMTVAIRLGLPARGETRGATLGMLLVATSVALVAAAPHHDLGDAAQFFAAGLLAPGISQLLFTRAIVEVGASRTSAVAGAAPLVALTIAFTFLHEPVKAGLVLGGVAIVAGGVLLALERTRPAHLRARGLLYAAGAAVGFAVRDNIVRALHAHGSPETVAAATLLAGTVVAALAARRLPTRRETVALAPAGVLFAASYLMLFEAYFRGRVSVVSPLVATETLWALILVGVLLRQHERLDLRVVLGAGAIVAGGIVIGLSAVG